MKEVLAQQQSGRVTGRGLLLCLLIAFAAFLIWGRWLRPVDRGLALDGETVSVGVESESVVLPEPVAPLPEMGVGEREAPSRQRDGAPAEEIPAEQVVEDVDAPESFVFWCRVVGAANGALIEGASIQDHDTWARLGLGESHEVRACQTDRDGLARLELVVGIRGALRVDAAGFGSRIFAVSAGHEDPSTALEIRLFQAGNLTVHVQRLDGTPVEGAMVELAVPGYFVVDRRSGFFGSSTKLTWSQRVDGTGACRFEDLPPEAAITALATLEGQQIYSQPGVLTLDPGAEEEVYWTVGAGTRIVGLLREASGAAVGDQEIWIAAKAYNASDERSRIYFDSSDKLYLWGRTTTDANGRFAIEDVPAGRWYVGPAFTSAGGRGPQASGLAPVAEAVDLEAGAAVLELDLLADHGLFIDGRAVAPDGGEVQRTLVRAYSELGYLDGEGEGAEFRIGPISNTEHQVRCSGTSGYSASPWVRAQPGEEITLELAMGAGFTGYFVNATTGERLNASYLICRKGHGLISKRPSAVVEFSARSLKPGTYYVAACTPGGFAGTLEDIVLGPGEFIESLEMPLELGARVLLKHAGGELPVRCEFEMEGLVVAMVFLQSGMSVEAVVPAGTDRVKAHWKGRDAAVYDLSCAAGVTLELTIEPE